MKREKLMVAAIENGAVIDHIPSEKLFAVIRLLHIEELDHDKVFIGYNLHSHIMPRKSIVKIATAFSPNRS
jgi:aspartate carbamoyltransferase, regulatory subunit